MHFYPKSCQLKQTSRFEVKILTSAARTLKHCSISLLVLETTFLDIFYGILVRFCTKVKEHLNPNMQPACTRVRLGPRGLNSRMPVKCNKEFNYEISWLKASPSSLARRSAQTAHRQQRLEASADLPEACARHFPTYLLRNLRWVYRLWLAFLHPGRYTGDCELIKPSMRKRNSSVPEDAHVSSRLVQPDGQAGQVVALRVREGLLQ